MLFLPVHKAVRELDGKLFFALKAANRGFSSIIGSSPMVRTLLKEQRPGVYFDFRMNQSRVTLDKWSHEKVRKLGHEIWLFDEEVTSLDQSGAFAKTQISAEVVERASKVLAWSEYHANLVHEVSSSAEVYVTGHPRYDVYNHRVREIYNRDARRHFKAYGNYVLVASSFGELAFGGRDAVDERIKVHVAKGFFKEPSDSLLFIDHYEYYRKTLQLFMDGIVKLARAHQNLNFVVRPHFNETHEMWSPILKHDLSNLHVVHDGPIASWIHGSVGLLHNHCSTAIEAYLLGKQVVSYVPVEDKRFERFLPSAVSTTVRSLPELIKAVVKLRDGVPLLGPEDIAPEISHYLRQGESLASENILDLLEKRDSEGVAGVAGVAGIAGVAEGLLGAGRKQIPRWQDIRRWLHSVRRKETEEISNQLVQQKLRDFIQQDNSFRGIVAKKIAREAFFISRP